MLSQMLRAEDFTGVALDRRYDPILDIATDEGFKVFRVAQRRLMPHCLAWWGIECKTWVWMCRAAYGRTKDVPLGNPALKQVVEANTVMGRFTFLALVLWFGLRLFIVEQPQSSLLNSAQPIEVLFEVTSAKLVRVDHGYYDVPDAPVKPLKLMGTAPWLQEMNKTIKMKPYGQRAKLCDKKRKLMPDGTWSSKWTGKRNEMSESEHYCAGFARELAHCHKCWFNNGQPFIHQALPARPSGGSSFLHAMH